VWGCPYIWSWTGLMTANGLLGTRVTPLRWGGSSAPPGEGTPMFNVDHRPGKILREEDKR
jgi:hypothetical protein